MPLIDKSPENRCALTNRSRTFLEDVDERTPFARRFSDVLKAHISDLGSWDAVSEAQASIARRAAMITVQLELLECKMARLVEPNVDLADLYSRLTNTLRRALESIGLERRARTISALELTRSLASVPQRPPSGEISES